MTWDAGMCLLPICSPWNHRKEWKASNIAHLGIDIGTSNALVSIVTSHRLPELLSIGGETIVPLVVYIGELAANPVVGQSALDMWADPYNGPLNLDSKIGHLKMDSHAKKTVSSPSLSGQKEVVADKVVRLGNGRASLIIGAIDKSRKWPSVSLEQLKYAITALAQ